MAISIEKDADVTLSFRWERRIVSRGEYQIEQNASKPCDIVPVADRRCPGKSGMIDLPDSLPDIFLPIFQMPPDIGVAVVHRIIDDDSGHSKEEGNFLKYLSRYSVLIKKRIEFTVDFFRMMRDVPPRRRGALFLFGDMVHGEQI
jgi:hypothetical protein